MKILIRAIIWISSITLIGSVFLIIKIFSGSSISNSFDSWSLYATILSGFSALAQLIVITSLTITYQKENKSLQESIERPFIIFKNYDEAVNDPALWDLINLGNGPALNISLTYKSSQTGEWQSKVNCYSLGKKQKLALHWLRGQRLHTLLALYSDNFSKNVYFSIGMGDKTTFGILKDRKVDLKIFNLTYEKLNEINNSTNFRRLRQAIIDQF